ncbi:MAG: helix-turn-helix domain-containing protein [Symbiobacteriaceae bacterium]
MPRFELLREAMQRRGWTYTAVALRSGLSLPHVRRVLLGRHHHVSALVLARLCRVLGVPLTAVMADELAERKTG